MPRILALVLLLIARLALGQSLLGTMQVQVLAGPDGGAELPIALVAATATQPVSGTLTCNAGSGSWWQTTQPVSAAALPLPSGASTAAKQPALGTAGSASADVLSVQGIASMTPLKTDGSATTQPVSGTLTCNAGAGTLAVSLASVPTHAVTLASTTLTGTSAVSAASLPLPSGASTEATLATLSVGQASTTSGQSGPLCQGATTTAAPAYVTAKTNPLSLNTAGGLRVDGSGVTQPVSGTVTCNAGTGTLAVSLAAAPTTAVTGTFFQATQPVSGTLTCNAGSGTLAVSLTSTTLTGTSAVSAASLPLPSGASTAAKQPALGTAGSASADVITIQGVASMTALKVDGSATTQPVSGTLTCNAGSGTQAVSIATAPVLVAGSALIGKVGIDQTTPGTTNACSLAQIGATTTDSNSGTKSAGTLRVVLATDQPALTNKLLVTPDSVALPANQSVNISQINGVTPLMGTGATGTGSPRATLATNSPGFSTSGGTIAPDSVLTAGRAVAYGSSPTAIAATTQAPHITDLEGRPYVNTGHPRTINCFVSTTATTSTQITGCEVVASNSIYITFAEICGDIASATASAATLQSGTSTACTGPHVLAAGYHAALGCVSFNFGMPGLKVTAAEGLCVLDGVTGTKKAMVVGYVAP